MNKKGNRIKEDDIRPAKDVEYIRGNVYYDDLKVFIKKFGYKFEKFHKCIACGSDNISLFIKKDGFKFYKCENCSCVFINPRPLESQLQWWYNSEFNIAASKLLDKTYDKRRPIYIHRVKDLLARINIKLIKDVLEIGCSSGQFITILKKEIGGRRLFAGIDLDKSAINLAKKNVKKK